MPARSSVFERRWIADGALLLLTALNNAMNKSNTSEKSPVGPAGGAGLRELTQGEQTRFGKLVARNARRRALQESGRAVYLDTREISDRLSFHQESVRRIIRAGRLPARRCGKRLRVALADFEAFVGAHPVGEGVAMRQGVNS